MKALITGINGFIGQHLEKFLIDKDIKVYGIEHHSSKYIKCDITNKEELKKVLNDIKPDMLFHLAAISAVETCEKDPEFTHKVNVVGFRNILEILEKDKINCKVLFASTSNVYGHKGKEILSETDDIDPISVYAKTKLEAEKLAGQFPDINIIIARNFNIIGPGQQIGFITSDFASQIVSIEKSKDKIGNIEVGNLETVRDYTDVRDIINAFYLLIQKGKYNEPYNVCSGKGYSGKELLDILMQNSDAKIKIIQKNIRKNDIEKLIGDNKKLKDDTGWNPLIPIEQSLKDILEYWRSKK